MNLAKDEPALECASHFKYVMNYPNRPGLAAEWMKLCRSLMEDHNLTSPQLKEFMTWAAQGNKSDTPQFSSVDYLAKANDPLVTLVKHAEGLIKVWRNSRKYKKVSKTDKRPPMYTNARMLGCSQEELDAVKKAHYGEGWETQPDPEDIIDYLDWGGVLPQRMVNKVCPPRPYSKEERDTKQKLSGLPGPPQSAVKP